MDSYTGFARLYDTFMEETPYDAWCSVIVEKLHKYKIDDGLVCELGAGTGKMTRLLRDNGYDMIAIDNSVEMLNVAKDKEGERDDILFLCQDMCEFELFGTVRAIVSVCDCVNYILEPSDLTNVFRLCNNYLDPEGILLFDFNTTHKYKDVIGETIIAENREEASFIWENFYDDSTKLNRYDITFFEKEGSLFNRFSETHIQRGYTLLEMKRLIAASGLKFLEAFDADTQKKPTRNSERIVIIAKEQGKKNE